MIQDAELLRQYVERHSDSAFAELVRRHVDLVYSVALRKVGGDAHAAQDVAQAVFIALARQAASLTQRSTLTGWVYVTTHHFAAQTVRADRRRQVREHAAHTMDEIFNTPDVDWPKLRPVLDDAMQELTEPDREAVLLRYFERRAFADIGRVLHVTEDAARMRVDRALEKLRTLLARRGVSSTATALATVLGSQVAAAPAGLATAISSAVAASALTGTVATAAVTFMTSANMITGLFAFVASAPPPSFPPPPATAPPNTRYPNKSVSPCRAANGATNELATGNRSPPPTRRGLSRCKHVEVRRVVAAGLVACGAHAAILSRSLRDQQTCITLRPLRRWAQTGRNSANSMGRLAAVLRPRSRLSRRTSRN